MENSKYCINCGKPMAANARFCTNCGAEQVNVSEVERHQGQTNFNSNSDTLNTGDYATSIDRNVVQQPKIDEPVNVVNATMNAVKNMFDFTGIISRAEYWWAVLGVSLIYLVCYIILDMIASYGSESMEVMAGVLFLIICVFGGILSWSMGFRRLHDTGRSGWYFLFSFIPIVGAIVVIVLCCQPSSEHPYV